jgi:glycosyltransferase involved in cell wall biosynthesis
MRFAVITYIPHSRQNNRYYSYAPYIREMNMWFQQANEVSILAPQKKEMPGNTEEPYRSNNLKFFKVPVICFIRLREAITSLRKLPYIVYSIFKVMRKADHIHLRCPGNISLIGCFLQVFFPKKPKTVKYAGNWDPEAKQPWTYKLQQRILSNTFLSRNIKVLVYGEWPGQSKNILPFFTASFLEEEREFVVKDFKPPYKFIFTGNLVEGKGIFEAINLIGALKEKRVDAALEIYGDGVLKDSLSDYIKKKELQKFVILKGRKSLGELKQAYKEAHFVVLLSKSEGWPKAIAEGMWYGCIPVATAVSCVPWMLNYGERGILIQNAEKRKENREKRAVIENVSRTGFSEKDLARMIRLLENPEKLREMSLAAQEWSQEYTLERFEKSIRKILKKQNPNPKSTTHNSRLTTQNREPTPDNRQPK